MHLRYRQKLPVLFLFFTTKQEKWALILPLEAFSELISHFAICTIPEQLQSP